VIVVEAVIEHPVRRVEPLALMLAPLRLRLGYQQQEETNESYSQLHCAA
jgi:hypothetical protein